MLINSYIGLLNNEFKALTWAKRTKSPSRTHRNIKVEPRLIMDCVAVNPLSSKYMLSGSYSSI
jgi:hypothetical protein